MEVIKDAILELRREGTTILFSTHDMEVAERMCDFILMIHRGRKVLDGTLEPIQAAATAPTPSGVRASGGQPGGTGAGARTAAGRGPGERLRPPAGAAAGAGGRSPGLLRALVGQVPVEHFEVARPHLHDIFVRIAGPTPHRRRAWTEPERADA